MGRWLKKLENMPGVALTKLTQPGSVSFVSADLEHIQENKSNLTRFITQCCKGITVDPQQVIDHLLSIEDVLDIKNGNISAEVLRLSIQLWMSGGMPYQSGKSMASMPHNAKKC